MDNKFEKLSKNMKRKLYLLIIIGLIFIIHIISYVLLREYSIIIITYTIIITSLYLMKENYFGLIIIGLFIDFYSLSYSSGLLNIFFIAPLVIYNICTIIKLSFSIYVSKSYLVLTLLLFYLEHGLLWLIFLMLCPVDNMVTHMVAGIFGFPIAIIFHRFINGNFKEPNIKLDYFHIEEDYVGLLGGALTQPYIDYDLYPLKITGDVGRISNLTLEKENYKKKYSSYTNVYIKAKDGIINILAEDGNKYKLFKIYFKNDKVKLLCAAKVNKTTAKVNSYIKKLIFSEDKIYEHQKLKYSTFGDFDLLSFDSWVKVCIVKAKPGMGKSFAINKKLNSMGNNGIVISPRSSGSKENLGLHTYIKAHENEPIICKDKFNRYFFPIVLIDVGVILLLNEFIDKIICPFVYSMNKNLSINEFKDTFSLWQSYIMLFIAIVLLILTFVFQRYIISFKKMDDANSYDFFAKSVAGILNSNNNTLIFEDLDRESITYVNDILIFIDSILYYLEDNKYTKIIIPIDISVYKDDKQYANLELNLDRVTKTLYDLQTYPLEYLEEVSSYKYKYVDSEILKSLMKKDLRKEMTFRNIETIIDNIIGIERKFLRNYTYEISYIWEHDKEKSIGIYEEMMIGLSGTIKSIESQSLARTNEEFFVMISDAQKQNLNKENNIICFRTDLNFTDELVFIKSEEYKLLNEIKRSIYKIIFIEYDISYDGSPMKRIYKLIEQDMDEEQTLLIPYKPDI